MGKKRGDRKDGRWIRDIDGFHFIMPYLMPNRCDSEVYIEELIDVTEMVKYIEAHNSVNKEFRLTPFHVITAAVGKIIYHRPYLNRFVAGRRLYQRNKITLAFVVKRRFNDEAEESLLVTEIKEDTTLEQISRRIAGDAQTIRKEGGNDINDLLDKLSKLPRWLMRLAMCVFRFLDFHGWMPESICRGDSNYASVLLSNLGSIKCNVVYHHLNNYGTNSIVITIGRIHKELMADDDGNTSVRDVVAIGATADERIADGFYFARSIRMLEEILRDPQQLENKMKSEIRQRTV
ncbi:MAG: 2-oxo acid dehydrogenase subunit E2 [Clostridiales bacterium]|nr:2-oxo acid dehydrogenase subunit E2 [Clostridiales bacterium]